MAKEKVTLVKAGGKVLDSEQELSKLLSTMKAIEGKKVLVHGGGVFITDLCEKLNIKTEMVDGRRITSKENMDVVLMACAGKLNKELVAGLNKLDMMSVGLCGGDLNIIDSIKRNPEPINFGQVGDVVAVNTEWLNIFLDKGVVPVVSSISQSDEFELLNTNADTIASNVAVALSNKYEVELFFYFDKVGVLKDAEDESTLIPELTKAEVNQLKEQNIIHKGMLPKLQNGFFALDNGVAKVKLGKALGQGTQLFL